MEISKNEMQKVGGSGRCGAVCRSMSYQKSFPSIGETHLMHSRWCISARYQLGCFGHVSGEDTIGVL
jgi:hypothetical protein